MDGKTKLNELYTAKDNIITLDVKNAENSDEVLNDTQGWGEHGATVELINTSIIKESITTRSYDDVHEHPPRYYVEELISLIILKDTGIEVDMDYITNLGEPTNVSEGQLLHYARN
jgi:hypothetical protein